MRGLVVTCVVVGFACGGAAAPSAQSSTASSAPSTGSAPDTPAILAFKDYDGPAGTLRPLGAYAWTVAPSPDLNGGPCVYSTPQLAREHVVGQQGGRVVFELEEDAKCRFSVPPALVYEDDTAPLKPGMAVLWSNKDTSWYARVVSVDGASVTLLFSHGTTIEMKFDASAFGTVKTTRDHVRALHDVSEYGGRVAIPQNDGLALEPLFAIEAETVWVAKPFGTKVPRERVRTAVFGRPIPAGTKVAITNPSGGFLMLGKVRRSLKDVVYEVEVKDGSTAIAAFEDVVTFL